MKKIIKASLVASSLLLSNLVASDVLATVNGVNITKQDAANFVRSTVPNANYQELTDEQKQMITDRLVERILFMEAANKDGIENKPEFKASLEKIKQELKVNLWMKAQMDNALVSDSEAKEFYDNNKAKFNVPATVHARHILVADEKTAKELIATLKPLKDEALKTKFIELAKAKSTGPTGPNGGDLGSFAQGQMVPEFDKAVFALKKGEITVAPVKTQFGYHVIYLEDTKEPSTIAFDDVKEKIIMTLKQQQFQAKLKEVATEMKTKAKITFPDAPKSETPSK
jgi:parvulin-like peptidyl-prolyl isomerase